jgi:predicted nucleic acid-binding protein
MISFDTNILVYATLSAPLAKTARPARTWNADGSSILRLQTLAEFSSVAIRTGKEVDAVRTTSTRNRNGVEITRRLVCGGCCAPAVE